MEKVVDAGLRPCPLCRHEVVMELECDNPGGTLSDVVRCAYCGCRIGIAYTGGSHDFNVEYLKSSWNNRVEYCQYCGGFTGAVERCPHCGSALLAKG